MVYRVPMQPELGFKCSAGDRRISFQFKVIETVREHSPPVAHGLKADIPSRMKGGLHHMSHLCWRSVHGFSMLGYASLRVQAFGFGK